MLTIQNSIDGLPRLSFDMTNNEDSTQREDVYNGLLNTAVENSINKIFDNEVTEFKPESQELSFYVFFSAFRDLEWLEQLKQNTEEAFKFYYSDQLSKLAIQSKLTVTNPKTLLQHTGIPAPKHSFLFSKKIREVLLSKPYTILDPVEEITYKAPTKSGIPLFYNSMALPYTKSLEKWGSDALGFSNKTFLYNSFLLLDFYTTNNPLTQKKVMSIPVYVNGRYMDYEQSVSGIKQIRPAFFLNNSTEGYSVIWLKEHNLDKLYVKVSFWDALNGEQIQLLPSSQYSEEKKWVQNADKFKQENLYLQYSFDYRNKTYRIREYNNKTGAYDIVATSFDVYQLVYDSYFYNLAHVPNTRPYKIEVETDVAGNDINIFMSQLSLSKTIDAPFDSNHQVITQIEQHYEKKPKGILGSLLAKVFKNQQVKLKDKAITYFEDQFDDLQYYTQPLGDISMTNNTGKDLIIRKFEVRDIYIQNKNNFIEGQPIYFNRFSKSSVSTVPSTMNCETVFTFKGSSFFRKLNPIRRPYDSLSTAVYNNQANSYSSYYFDEANNKVVEKTQSDINEAINKLTEANKVNLAKNLLLGGFGIIKSIVEAKQQQQKIQGLNMTEKDLNLIMRSEVLEKSGAKKQYELLFPCTNEKLVRDTEKYRPFSVQIKTSATPQHQDFKTGLSVKLSSDVSFGKEFFKLFISGNDDIILTYNVVISMVDATGNQYKKVIPCKLTYI